MSIETTPAQPATAPSPSTPAAAAPATPATVEELRETALRDPLAALEAIGFDYEKVTEFMINGRKPTPEMAVEALERKTLGRIEAMRREMETERQAKEEARQAQTAAEQREIVERFETEATEYVKEHAADYELVNLYGQHETVLEVIQENFRQTGKLMTAAEAASLVESHLAEEVDRGAAARAKRAAPPPTSATPADPVARALAAMERVSASRGAPAPAPAADPSRPRDPVARALAAMEAIERKRAGK